MTAYTQPQHSNFLKAADGTYPRVMYSPGKMPVTVTTAAELAALGSGWFATNVSE
jgi:hypothetical protein